jgi:hypothetical protein
MGVLEFELIAEKVGANGARSRTKQPDDVSFHRRIHLDQRRPGALETFDENFLRRINAEFAAAGDVLIGNCF